MSITIDEVCSTPTSKVTIRLRDEKIQITPGVLDAASAYLFSHGHCHSLAVVLARRLGAPLKLVVSSFDDQEKYLTSDGTFLAGISEVPSSEIDDAWYHAVVQVGTDEYLDVSGIASRADLLERYFNSWDPGMLIDTTETQIRELSRRCAITVRLNTKLAEPFADAVLSEFLQ